MKTWQLYIKYKVDFRHMLVFLDWINVKVFDIWMW